MHVGNLIKEVMDRKNVSAIELSNKIYCTRTHVYKIYTKESIDTNLLIRISIALEYDFFACISRMISNTNSKPTNVI